MDDLKELRVNNGVLILDKNRVMSPIIPQGYRDIDNDVLVKGETYVDAAVYARQFNIEQGPLTVCGACFVKSNLSSRLTNHQVITFKKAVASGGKIELFDDGKKYFGADLNAGVVKLKNAVVAANLFATEIFLENCVVFGGVFATKTLQMNHSVVGTFNAPSAVIAGSNYILYPSVFSVEPLHVVEGAKLFNLTLADWGNLLKGLPESPLSGVIEIDPAADEQKVSLRDQEGNVTLWETYSVAGKVLAADMLDLKKLDNHFMLSIASLGEQLIKQYDFGCDKNGAPIKLNLETIGDFFGDILDGKIVPRSLDAKVSFDDLKKFYAEQA